ncbi:MAG: primosomal protein N' [Candidatus Paceibacterota bacterium]
MTKETLSYFSANEVSLGSLVRVPVRKKTVPAIVVSVRKLEEMRSEVKNSAFSLKRVERIRSSRLLRKEFLETAEIMSKYYVGSTASVLSSMIPKVLFESVDKLKIPEETIVHQNTRAVEKFVIQSNDEDRYAHYKSIIREEFAKGLSVFFCLPTIQDTKRASEILKKGIEAYTFTLHGMMNKKEEIEIINKILGEKHPVLIIATGSFLAIPKEKIGTIIVDKEGSRSYKQQTRPYIDIRNFAEHFSQKIKAKVIFGDLLLRAETIWRYNRNELVEVAPLKFRSLTTSSQEIVDMSTKHEEGEKKKEFEIFGESLKNTIKETVENNERMFIFTARRGFSPSTVCADCEHVVKCNSCKAHIVLHKGTNDNFFLCHKCGERRSANEKCANCGGFRLTTLGIGAELIETKIREMHPNAHIWRIDADVAPSHKKALSIAEKFYNSPEGFLIGTESALLYLTLEIENSAIVSMDSFFSIPDFRVNERIMNIILKMRAMTDRKLIIQTRDMKQKVFEYATAGNLIDFFRDEIDDRKSLKYPPFSTLVKISVTGNRNNIVSLMENLQKHIGDYELDIFPAFIPQKKGQFSMNGVIKVPEGKWPDNGLIEVLRSLSPNFTVNVDPDSLI